MPKRNRFLEALVISLLCPSVAIADPIHRGAQAHDLDASPPSPVDASTVQVHLINTTPARGPVALLRKDNEFSAYGSSTSGNSVSMAGESYSLVCGSPCDSVVSTHSLYHLDAIKSGLARRLTSTKPFMLSEFAGKKIQIEIEGPRPGLVYGGLVMAIAGPSTFGVVGGAMTIFSHRMDTAGQRTTVLVLGITSLLAATAMTIGGIMMIKKGRTKYKTPRTVP